MAAANSVNKESHLRANRGIIALQHFAGNPVGTGWPQRAIGVLAMKYLYIGLIVVFTAIVLLFKIQNMQVATGVAGARRGG